MYDNKNRESTVKSVGRTTDWGDVVSVTVELSDRTGDYTTTIHLTPRDATLLASELKHFALKCEG